MIKQIFSPMDVNNMQAVKNTIKHNYEIDIKLFFRPMSTHIKEGDNEGEQS